MKRAALLSLFALAGCTSPTGPSSTPAKTCHVETVPASDHCDTYFDAAGRPYLLCYTIPASSHEVCQ